MMPVCACMRWCVTHISPELLQVQIFCKLITQKLLQLQLFLQICCSAVLSLTIRWYIVWGPIACRGLGGVVVRVLTSNL